MAHVNPNDIPNEVFMKMNRHAKIIDGSVTQTWILFSDIFLKGQDKSWFYIKTKSWVTKLPHLKDLNHSCLSLDPA